MMVESIDREKEKEREIIMVKEKKRKIDSLQKNSMPLLQSTLVAILL